MQPPKHRTDWRFLRALSRIDLKQPDATLEVYKLLSRSLTQLGFSRVAVTTFTDALQLSGRMGDTGLSNQVQSYHWKVWRRRETHQEVSLHIPIHFGYLSPIILSVHYNRETNRKLIPSLTSLVRLMYYYLRCNGLEQALEGKNLFISELTRSTLRHPHE